MELERGLPCNLDAERIVLGSILIGSADILILEAALAPTDFAIEKHRRIYQCALDLAHADTAPDRATVTNALSDRKELESCDGLSYLIDLDNNTLSLERRIAIRTALQLSTIVDRHQIHQSVRRSWSRIHLTRSQKASRHQRAQLQTV